MRRPILFGAFALVAFAVVGTVGLKLVGALRQIDAFVGTNAGAASSSEVAALPRAVPVEAAAVVAPARGGGAIVESTPATAEPPAPESGPTPRFDAEAAVREAGDRDANVAELLNDPDPAVGSAVRDFITHLDPPGGR